MLKFILKRLGSSLLVLFGASILLFFLVAHSGDPLQDLRESQNPNRETLIAARLLLGVKDDNHRAISFYAKHRFETVGTRRFDVGGKTYDDFVLARTL